MKEVEGSKQGQKRVAYLVLFYLLVTWLVNLGALVAVPSRFTASTASEIAKQTLPFYALPVLWAGYLLFMYRTAPLRRVGFVAALPGLFWLLAVIGGIRLAIGS